MKIYIASRMSRMAECANFALHLEELGHEVTSRWLRGLHSAKDFVDAHSIFAAEDLEDLRAAATCISLTGGGTRGGRHVEFGVALERGIKNIIVGPRESVFHYLPGVVWYPTADEFWKVNGGYCGDFGGNLSGHAA